MELFPLCRPRWRVIQSENVHHDVVIWPGSVVPPFVSSGTFVRDQRRTSYPVRSRNGGTATKKLRRKIDQWCSNLSRNFLFTARRRLVDVAKRENWHHRKIDLMGSSPCLGESGQ